MAKLTAVRMNGIRNGYWSPEKKEALTQRLGDLEHRGPRLLNDLCDQYCKYPERGDLSQEERMEICNECPMNTLMRMAGES